MLIRVVRPMKRKDSSIPYFVQRIPADVKARAVGLTLQIPVGDEMVPVTITGKTQAVKLSLRTRDHGEAKARQATVAAHLERVWSGLRQGPRVLSTKEAVALAGEIYRTFTEALEEEPGPAGLWQGVIEDNNKAFSGRFGFSSLKIGEAARRSGSLEERFGPFVDLVLAWKGLFVDAESRHKVLEHVAKAMDVATKKVRRNAEGDYSPDPAATRFPRWEDKKTSPPASSRLAPQASVTGLFDGWWKEVSAENKRSDSTREAYARSANKLVEFLGHDDATRVTPEDVVAFKDARLAEINPRTGKFVSAKTVNDGDLTALKTIFGWGVKNRRLPSNPAAGITITMAERQRVRDPGFTDEEATAILTKALRHEPRGKELPKTTAAKRWVPWLCAYTGARVGEMVQLRKKDIRQVDSFWVLKITPDAGTVKDRRFRDVPIHPHLIELGFIDFISQQPNGYLFFDPSENGGWKGPWQAVKNRLGELAREVVPDPGVQPNHGWRHRFITQAREHGIDPELRRMITGHRGEGIDERTYGRPAGLYREVCKLPRYGVSR